MLLKTRFYIPPLRAHDVVRPRLMSQLNSLAGGSLGLVVAPAGFGKTTVVSQWLHHNPHSFAWLMLDQSHSGDVRFWRYVIAALQTLMPQIGEQALTCLDQNDVDAALIALLNELDQQPISDRQAMTLVLDDIHKVENPTLLQSLNVFLDHLPACVRVVMTSRSSPELQLPRRRAMGQLLEITQQALAFTPQEVQDFLKNKNTPVLQGTQQDSQQLWQTTEGWITGLQLALMSQDARSQISNDATHSSASHSSAQTNAQANANTNTVANEIRLHRDIADYLFEEVFALQTQELQTFMLLTAIPKRFCTALANSLLDQLNTADTKTAAQTCLKTLEQLNVFLVPLDNHRVWYRYHDLFRQLLLQQTQDWSQSRLQQVHRAAANWFEQAGYPEDAVHHWVKLQDWSALETLWQSAALDRSHLVTWQHLIPHSVYGTLEALCETSAQAKGESAAESHKAAINTSRDANVGDPFGEPLTKREKQVMARVKSGLTNQQIADELHISLNTLKVHIRNLYGKMGVENRTQSLVKLNG